MTGESMSHDPPNHKVDCVWSRFLAFWIEKQVRNPARNLHAHLITLYRECGHGFVFGAGTRSHGSACGCSMLGPSKIVCLVIDCLRHAVDVRLGARLDQDQDRRCRSACEGAALRGAGHVPGVFHNGL